MCPNSARWTSTGPPPEASSGTIPTPGPFKNSCRRRYRPRKPGIPVTAASALAKVRSAHSSARTAADIYFERVHEGDRVLATDPHTGRHYARTVTRAWLHTDTFIHLRIDG